MPPPAAPAPAAPQPPPSPGKGTPKLGRLPLWAWIGAAAVGIVIGVLLLRRQPTTADEGTGDQSGIPDAEKGTGGGSVVSPIPGMDMLEAMGIRMPEQNYGWNGVSISDSGGSDSGSGSEASSSSGPDPYVGKNIDFFAALAPIANFARPTPAPRSVATPTGFTRPTVSSSGGSTSVATPTNFSRPVPNAA